MTSPWQFSGMSVVRLLLVLLLLVPAAPLMAMDDALLGRWAYAGGSCEEDMTIKIAKDGVSGTEYFCATKRIKRNKADGRSTFPAARKTIAMPIEPIGAC